LNRRGLVLGGAAGVLTSVLSGCATSNEATHKVYVLVDLSETWNNNAYADRNYRVLTEIGEGVADAATAWDPPVEITYGVIGQASYLSEPPCDVSFANTTLNTTKERPGYIINKRDELHSYLGGICRDKLLSMPQQAMTEITASLQIVVASGDSPKTKRFVIMASDFREEAQAIAPLKPGDLAGVKLLMLYRPIAEDQRDPAQLNARVELWKKSLISLGADVTARADTALKRSQISDFLQFP